MPLAAIVLMVSVEDAYRVGMVVNANVLDIVQHLDVIPLPEIALHAITVGLDLSA